MIVFSYTSDTTPDDYKCSKCQARGCKMWRSYASFHVELYCVDCAAKKEEKDISSLRDDGTIKTQHGDRIDQIGWLVPAVPTENNLSYWGYTSVPAEACEWWQNLPNRANTDGTR